MEAAGHESRFLLGKCPHLFTLTNIPFRLLFGLRPLLLSSLFQCFLLILLALSLHILWYLVPKPAVDPQCFLQAQATANARHPATQGAAHRQQPAPDLWHSLQARVTEGVSAVEHPGDSVCPRVGLEADTTLAVLTQNHGESQRGTEWQQRSIRICSGDLEPGCPR